jgi:hypothetical protein
MNTVSYSFKGGHHQPKEGHNMPTEKFSLIRVFLGKLGLSKEAVKELGLTVLS